MKKGNTKIVDTVMSSLDWDSIYEVNKCFKHGVGDGVCAIPGIKRKSFSDSLTKNDIKNELKCLVKFVIENDVPELIYGYWMIFWTNSEWTEKYLDKLRDEAADEDEEDIIDDLDIGSTLEVIYSPQRIYLNVNIEKGAGVNANDDALDSMLKKALSDENFELASKITELIKFQNTQGQKG